VNETTTQETTVGIALVRLLEDYGVERVFGIPGVHTLELYRGLADSGLKHVLSRHEQGAGFMADGYARASGRPGVCFVITGPGLTNIMTALGQAYSDSMPLLVISSVNAQRDLGRGRGCLHEMRDQQAAAATVTGFSATARTPEEIPELLARAFALFASERPRPVHIEIPLDVLAAPASGDWRAQAPPSRPAPDPETVAEAARRLAQAERPAVIYGGGAVEAAAELAPLVERLGAVAVPTQAGKGILPDDHPRCLGGRLPRPEARAYLAEADVVLAVGTELAETDLWGGRIAFSGTVVRIDLDPDKLTAEGGELLALQADAAAALRAIAENLAAEAAPNPARISLEEIAELRRSLAAEEAPMLREHRRVHETLRAALPAASMVVTDMTQLAYSGAQVFPVFQPRSWLHPSGFGTLGYALPAAIGAKLGAPERPVVAMAGDFGLMFTLPELAVAVELGLRLPILLWNNDALGQIRDDMLLAKAFGCHGERVESHGALTAAVAAALERPGPSLIEIVADSL
jgi:thiamine pyrophosphate-dependent acetolactate synthase large subunit-like protein